MDNREEYIRNNINSIAESAFPDNIGNTWIIHEILEQDKQWLVEVEPQPDDVGYTRFRFTIVFSVPDNPHITECYCLNEFGSWGLLFSD